ncbi:MAG TPA: NUDIX hydrolase [Patescibacteria group bacterium]|nr:NUDIX hydrolase [Patescibacteria group bacterium]
MKKQQHIPVVAVVFNKKGDMFLAQRDELSSKYTHGKWQLPEGGIAFGEHPRNCAKREVKDETGITVSQDNHTGDARWFTYEDIDFSMTLPLSLRKLLMK